MRYRWFATSTLVTAVAWVAVYGSWLYVKSVARETFENDSLKVKQSFYEGVKAAESAVQSLESFAEAVPDGDQTRFGRFASDLMSKLEFVVGATYYRHVAEGERSAYEADLKSRNLGGSLLETSPADKSKVGTAGARRDYFVVDAVDAAAKEQSYFGWDALSDPAKEEALKASVTGGQPKATATFLLDSGNVAFEIFAPVRGEGGQLRGVVGTTIDLTKMLGEQRWRQGVTIIMTTVLAGEAMAKDIYRSLDLEPAQWPGLGSLASTLEVERFGQKLGLKFEKALYPGRVNLAIVAMAAAAAALLAVLALYLQLTYGRLQISLSGLAEANATLEQKVAVRTKDLALAHNEIKEILDNLDEVVFAVGADGKIGPVYSPASRRLLGREDFTGLDIKEVLFSGLDRHDEESSRHLFALSMLASFDDLQWSISSSDLLKISTFQAEGGPRRTFSLRYSPIFEADVIRKLIVVASDVTEIMSLKEDLAARELEASTKDAVLSELAAADKRQLQGFFVEADERMLEVDKFADAPQPEDVLPVLRSLHTLKGGSRSVGLKTLAKRVHEVEDGLEVLRETVAGGHPSNAESEGTPQLAQVIAAAKLDQVRAMYASYRQVFKDLFETSRAAAAPHLVARILPFLRTERNARNDLIKWYEGASCDGITSVAEVVTGFATSITELAEQLSKRVTLEIPKWDLYVDPTLKGPLTEAFTHALRNAVDHGIEGIAARAAQGKAEHGRIWLEQEVSKDHVILTVADDGGGVDLARVHAMATGKGLVSQAAAQMDAASILDLLFLPGFSTKTSISEVSGRGIGLDAVRSTLSTHGVTCRIRSQAGHGSRFEFCLPRSLVRFVVTEQEELQAVA